MADRSSSKKPKKYTYADYLTWPEGDRREIIDGVIYDMTPSPTPEHQEIVLGLGSQFHNFLHGKKCRVFPDLDVVLPRRAEPDEKVETTVRPDLLVLCDTSKLDGTRVRGAPDLCIEIISPTSGSYDAIFKRRLYEKAGVKEYWLVHPVDRMVTVFVLEADGTFSKPMYYDDTGKIAVAVVRGLIVDLSTVFPQRVPDSTREGATRYTTEKKNPKKGARR